MPVLELELTKRQIIADLPRAFRENNDISSMSNNKLVAAWKRHGTHAGTWEWDDVTIVED